MMQASIVKGSVNVSETDTNALWHRRLSHMSERGLKCLLNLRHEERKIDALAYKSINSNLVKRKKLNLVERTEEESLV